jgi:hypothetical protein
MYTIMVPTLNGLSRKMRWAKIVSSANFVVFLNVYIWCCGILNWEEKCLQKQFEMKIIHLVIDGPIC